MAASSIVAETSAAEAEPPAVSLVTTARLINKEEAGTSSDDGIGMTKEASYISGGEIGITKALLDKHLLKTGVAAEPDLLRALLYKFAEGGAKHRRRSEPVVPPVTMTKVRMPDDYIESIKRRPMHKIRPLPDSMYQDDPKLREFLLDTNANLNYMVDMQQDCLRQYAEKGYAEIGVDYTDDGLQEVYILPHQPQTQVTMTQQQQGNDGGGRRKTTLVFVRGFAILFALLVVLLSFLLLSRVNVQV